MILEIKNLSKFYPPNLWAVKNINLSFEKGLIHAIIGENGAGKSTLMKICYGLIPFEEGEILLNSQVFEPKNPQDALKNGIGMVHQEFMLFDELTVYENILLGYEPTSKLGLLDRKKMKDLIQQKNEQYNFNLNIEAPIKVLSVAAKQKVELLKLLFLDSSILIFDEPTSVLTPQECKEFFEYLNILKSQGKTIFYIGHKLEDVLQISDTISILRKGTLISHYTDLYKNPVSKKQLIADMIDSQESKLLKRQEIPSNTPILSLENINLSPTDNYVGLKDINITINKYEITGIAAIEGHGQSELVQVIIGALPQHSGTITLDTKDISHQPLEKRRKNISFVSPNRTLFSSCQIASILDNIIMGHHTSSMFHKFMGFFDKKKIIEFYTHSIKKYNISIPDYHLPISSLSGGNQQKIILARESENSNSLTVLEQPTRGLDVNSISYIHNLILEKRDKGSAVFLVSSDLDELMVLCDTLLIMFDGAIIASYKRSEFDLNKIGHKMLMGTTNEK